MATVLFAAIIGIAVGAFIVTFTSEECYDDTLVSWDTETY